MFPADEQLDEEHPIPASDEERHSKFFMSVGGGCMLLGALIALLDIMHNPVFSALAGLLFLFIGGVCVMLTVGYYLKDYDEKYIETESQPHDIPHH